MICLRHNNIHIELDKDDVGKLKKGESIEGILRYFDSRHYEKCFINLNEREDSPCSIYFNRSGECAEKEVLYVHLPKNFMKKCSYYGNCVLETPHLGNVYPYLN